MRSQEKMRLTMLGEVLSFVTLLFMLLQSNSASAQPATNNPSRTFIYLSHDALDVSDNYRINQYRVETNGSLTPLKAPTLTLKGHCSELVTDSGGKHVYVISKDIVEKRRGHAVLQCSIVQYKVSVTGQLAPLEPEWISINPSVDSAVMSDNGKLLYVFSNNQDESKGISVSIFRVAKDGTLHPISFGTHSFLGDPHDKYVLNRFPVREVIDPTGHFLYILVDEKYLGEPLRDSLYLTQFRILSNGNLYPIQHSAVSDGLGAKRVIDYGSSLGLGARDGLVFASNGHGTVAYKFGVDGKLKHSPALFPDQEINVKDFAYDAARHCLFGLGQPDAETTSEPFCLVKYRFADGGHLVDRNNYVISVDGGLSPYDFNNFLVSRMPVSPQGFVIEPDQPFIGSLQLDATVQRLYCCDDSRNVMLAYGVDKDGNIASHPEQSDLGIKGGLGEEHFLLVTRH